MPFQRFWGQLPVGFPSSLPQEHARPSPDFGGKDPSLSPPRQERFDDDKRQELGHGIYQEIEGDESDEVMFRLGDKGENIELLQRRLQNIGYEVELNGVFDRHLANIIFAFKLHYFQHSLKLLEFFF